MIIQCGDHETLASLDIKLRERLDGDQVRQTVPEIVDESPSERTLTFRTSDETVDAYGDIIRVAGWDLSDWEKNRVFLWHHNRGLNTPQPPIAVGVKDQITKKALIQTFSFASAETYPFADTIYKLYRGVEDPKLGRVRFLHTTSVGFKPVTYEVPDDKKKAKLGMGKYGVIFTHQLLKEVSAVTVPANPNASLINAWRAMAAKGTLTDNDLDLMQERDLLSDALKLEWMNARDGGKLISIPSHSPEGTPREGVQEFEFHGSDETLRAIRETLSRVEASIDDLADQLVEVREDISAIATVRRSYGDAEVMDVIMEPKEAPKPEKEQTSEPGFLEIFP
jgi:hypothetical protein